VTGAGVRRRGPQGFTLIEVVVVMLVVGLAAAVVVPGVGRGVDAFRARAEVSGFSAFLRYAREQAVVRRVSQEVRVDPEARLLVLTAAGSERARASRRIGEGIRVAATGPSGLIVKFLPEGRSSGAAFRIEGPGGRVYTVTVDALTGRVVNRRGDA
jgi:general secretion pathway protein H